MWLSMRLQLLACLIITAVALLAVAGHLGLTAKLAGVHGYQGEECMQQL